MLRRGTGNTRNIRGDTSAWRRQTTSDTTSWSAATPWEPGMTLSFTSQVTPPRGPRHLIGRDRLVQPLLAALDKRLVTVVAPGGAGKTSLLADAARSAGRPPCWLTLDEWLADPLD